MRKLTKAGGGNLEPLALVNTPEQDRQLKLPRERVGGRYVTAYSPELALKMCEQIANGWTLSALCREDGYPLRQTFHRWVVQTPELARAYAAAKELSAHAMEEEALDMARLLTDGGDKVTQIMVRAFEVAMNQLRWSAMRRNPKVYSDKGLVSITVPIQINTSLDMGANATAPNEEMPNIYTISAEVKVPVEEVEAEGKLLTGKVPAKVVHKPKNEVE